LLKGYAFQEISTSAQVQTAQWRMLREIVHGRRLHIPNTPMGRELVNELAQLRAWSLANGLMRVEGTRDDLADALKIAIAAASAMPANDMGGIEVEYEPLHWLDSPSNLQGGTPRFFKRDAAGKRVTSEPPYGSDAFLDWMANAIRSGWSTPSIHRYLSEHPDADPMNQKQE